MTTDYGTAGLRTTGQQDHGTTLNREAGGVTAPETRRQGDTETRRQGAQGAKRREHSAKREEQEQGASGPVRVRTLSHGAGSWQLAGGRDYAIA